MPSPKSHMIYNWKKSGLICDDYNALYETYIETTQCQHCKTEFTKNNCRCLDHDHETGLFRKIVCNRCNSMDSYIRFPNGFTEQDRKEYHQEYYQANKEKFTEQNKEYQRANKDTIKEYQQAYRQKNKQKLLEQRKEYRQANKDKLKEYNQEKIKCDCGSIVCRAVIAKHRRSKKHSDYIASSLV